MPLLLRPEVILKLVVAARAGLVTEAHNTSAEEVYAAVFTLARDMAKSANATHADLEPFRTMVAQIYAEFPKQVTH